MMIRLIDLGLIVVSGNVPKVKGMGNCNKWYKLNEAGLHENRYLC